MNILNRLLIILVLLAAVAAVALFAAAPAEMLGLVAGPVVALQSLAARLLPAGRLLVAIVGLAVVVVLLFWLWLELRRPRPRTVQVRLTDGAEAEVTTQTLTERVQHTVDALPGVVTASARVRSFGKSVEVAIEAEIAPGLQVANQADTIAAAVRETTETTMGLALRGKPRIRIKAIRMPDPPPQPAPARKPEPAARLPAPRPEEAEPAPATAERSQPHS